MTLMYVNSSFLEAVGYDEAEETMEIKFNSGSIYSYYNVPESVYVGFLEADSHGSYFNTLIKRRYSYERIA